MSRAIEATADLQTLQGIAKQLLQALQSQKAATQWVMRQQLGTPAQIAPGLAQHLAHEALVNRLVSACLNQEAQITKIHPVGRVPPLFQTAGQPY